MDGGALHRIRSHFSKPRDPMGEAWFMGDERLLFTELLEPLEGLSAHALQKPLEEIASGTSSFGPMREWNEWYHYLLGQVLPRCHEAFVSSLLESLITGFMALYPHGIGTAPYKGFEADALNTLGRCLMDSRCWRGEEIAVGTFLHRSNNNPNRVWCWWDASGDFSASMFFCLKYLPEDLVVDWLESVLAIPSAHWRAQVIVWAVGAHDMLRGEVKWPSELRVESRPSISWEWSHCLRGEAGFGEAESNRATGFLPDESRMLTLQTLQRHFTQDIFLEWLLSIEEVQYLRDELAEIPDTFQQLYITCRR
jgi:hypothetical protein